MAIAAAVMQMVVRSFRYLVTAVAGLALTVAGSAAARPFPPESVLLGVPKPEEAPVALLVDISSGQVLHARNPDRRFMPASVTKVMTLYLAFELIEQGKLDPAQIFVMTPEVARDWRRKGSTMFLDRGERVRVDDLLLGIANVSANDGAAVLAAGQAGSVAGWTAKMNSTARGLGMTGSYFGTPNGWPDEGRTFTTANDLVKLAQAMINRHPDRFGYYIGREGFDYKGIIQSNHDPMIRVVPGADGIKTGFTNESGYSYLGTAQRQGQRLVLVLAGVDTGRLRARLARDYVEWGFDAFDRRRLFDPEAVIADARVQNGDARHVPLVARGAVTINLPRGSNAKLKANVRYDGPLRAPLPAGRQVAVLEVTGPGVTTAHIPLYTAEAVGEAGPLDRIINAIAGVFS